MATFSYTQKATVHGNQRVTQILMSSADVEMNLQTSLKFVDAFFVQPMSMATVTTLKNFRANVNSTATVSNGMVSVSGISSGDQFYLVVFGK